MLWVKVLAGEACVMVPSEIVASLGTSGVGGDGAVALFVARVVMVLALERGWAEATALSDAPGSGAGGEA